MNKTVKELISPSGKYKSNIMENMDCFKVEIYELNEDIDLHTNESYGIYWSRKNKYPIFVDKEFSPESKAIEEIRNLMGEPDFPLTIEWVRDYSFCKDAEFIDIRDTRAFCETNNQALQDKKNEIIEATRIISFNGLCLVEEVGNEDDWLMGERDSNGDIYCWGYYGPLKKAIAEL